MKEFALELAKLDKRRPDYDTELHDVKMLAFEALVAEKMNMLLLVPAEFEPVAGTWIASKFCAVTSIVTEKHPNGSIVLRLNNTAKSYEVVDNADKSKKVPEKLKVCINGMYYKPKDKPVVYTGVDAKPNYTATLSVRTDVDSLFKILLVGTRTTAEALYQLEPKIFIDVYGVFHRAKYGVPFCCIVNEIKKIG